MTTWRKVLIEDNRFYRVKMCGILIADDARSWYESGRVTDVTVRGNVYRGGDGAFLQVLPENSRYAGSVHRHITVADNEIAFSQGNEKDSASTLHGRYCLLRQSHFGPESHLPSVF